MEKVKILKIVFHGLCDVLVRSCCFLNSLTT